MENIFTIDVDPDIISRANDSRTPLCVVVSKGDTKMVFPLYSIVTRKDTSSLDPSEQFYILNDFINRKGEEFQDLVIDTYQQVYNKLSLYSDAIIDSTVDVYEDIYKLFDLFPIEECIEHAQMLVNSGIVNIPSNLSTDIDENMIRDEIGSEEQTYLKGDYISLVGLVTFIKATFPILIHFESIFVNEKNGPAKDVALFDIYNNYLPFVESAPTIKLGQFTEQIVLGPKREKEDVVKQMLEKKLSRDEFKPYFLAQLVIERLTIAGILRDDDKKHTILTLYSFLMTRADSNGSAKNQIKQIRPLINEDNDVESIFEANMQQESLNLLTQRSTNVAFSSLDSVTNQFTHYPIYKPYIYGVKGMSGKEYSLEDIRTMLGELFGYPIPYTSVMLCKVFCKRILDPRLVPLLEINNMLNLMSVAFSYLYNLGYHHLALTLTTVEMAYDEDFNVYTGSDFKKVDQNLIEELRSYFPLFIPPNKQVKENTYIIETHVNDVSKLFLDTRRGSILKEEVVKDLFKDGIDYKVVKDTILVIPQTDVKEQLCEMLIENEKMVMGIK